MAIFRLNVEDDNLHNAELVIAKKTDIELESYLESWLENSPWALVEGEPILWIGRQTSANVRYRFWHQPALRAAPPVGKHHLL